MKKYKIQQILKVDDNDRIVVKQTIKYLKDNGFYIDTKHKTYYYTKYGKKIISDVNIYAIKDNKTYAIEADRKSPRQRTLKKLGNVIADYKIVFLRGLKENYNIGSIKVIYLEMNIKEESGDITPINN